MSGVSPLPRLNPLYFVVTRRKRWVDICGKAGCRILNSAEVACSLGCRFCFCARNSSSHNRLVAILFLRILTEPPLSTKGMPSWHCFSFTPSNIPSFPATRSPSILLSATRIRRKPPFRRPSTHNQQPPFTDRGHESPLADSPHPLILTCSSLQLSVHNAISPFSVATTQQFFSLASHLHSSSALPELKLLFFFPGLPPSHVNS